MVELLKQGQCTPFHIVDQVVSIYAGTKGFLDDVPVKSVPAFEKAMLNYFQTSGKPVWDELSVKRALDGDLEKKLTDALRAFKGTWKG